MKVTLTFNDRSKWILISEVLFETQPIIKPIPLLTTTNRNHLPSSIGRKNADPGINMIQYWHWLLLAISLLLLLMALLIIFYLQWIQSTQNRRKLHK